MLTARADCLLPSVSIGRNWEVVGLHGAPVKVPGNQNCNKGKKGEEVCSIASSSTGIPGAGDDCGAC